MAIVDRPLHDLLTGMMHGLRHVREPDTWTAFRKRFFYSPWPMTFLLAYVGGNWYTWHAYGDCLQQINNGTMTKCPTDREWFLILAFFCTLLPLSIANAWFLSCGLLSSINRIRITDLCITPTSPLRWIGQQAISWILISIGFTLVLTIIQGIFARSYSDLALSAGIDLDFGWKTLIIVSISSLMGVWMVGCCPCLILNKLFPKWPNFLYIIPLVSMAVSIPILYSYALFELTWPHVTRKSYVYHGVIIHTMIGTTILILSFSIRFLQRTIKRQSIR